MRKAEQGSASEGAQEELARLLDIEGLKPFQRRRLQSYAATFVRVLRKLGVSFEEFNTISLEQALSAKVTDEEFDQIDEFYKRLFSSLEGFTKENKLVDACVLPEVAEDTRGHSYQSYETKEGFVVGETADWKLKKFFDSKGFFVEMDGGFESAGNLGEKVYFFYRHKNPTGKSEMRVVDESGRVIVKGYPKVKMISEPGTSSYFSFFECEKEGKTILVGLDGKEIVPVKKMKKARESDGVSYVWVQISNKQHQIYNEHGEKMGDYKSLQDYLVVNSQVWAVVMQNQEYFIQDPLGNKVGLNGSPHVGFKKITSITESCGEVVFFAESANDFLAVDGEGKTIIEKKGEKISGLFRLPGRPSEEALIVSGGINVVKKPDGNTLPYSGDPRKIVEKVFVHKGQWFEVAHDSVYSCAIKEQFQLVFKESLGTIDDTYYFTAKEPAFGEDGEDLGKQSIYDGDGQRVGFDYYDRVEMFEVGGKPLFFVTVIERSYTKQKNGKIHEDWSGRKEQTSLININGKIIDGSEFDQIDSLRVLEGGKIVMVGRNGNEIEKRILTIG